MARGDKDAEEGLLLEPEQLGASGSEGASGREVRLAGGRCRREGPRIPRDPEQEPRWAGERMDPREPPGNQSPTLHACPVLGVCGLSPRRLQPCHHVLLSKQRPRRRHLGYLSPEEECESKWQPRDLLCRRTRLLHLPRRLNCPAPGDLVPAVGAGRPRRGQCACCTAMHGRLLRAQPVPRAAANTPGPSPSADLPTLSLAFPSLKSPRRWRAQELRPAREAVWTNSGRLPPPLPFSGFT